MSISEYICRERSQQSTIRREGLAEEFHSDRSRIVFASSFRRMIRKAQVFSLESNTSIRNRLTHTLEVADIGRTLARAVGGRLMETGRATQVDAECIQTIVENACLLHDIGNPPFGHFGEAAIQSWFKPGGNENVSTRRITLPKEFDCTDFLGFDGNPQGFRIATRLHTERDRYSLNLTYSTLLATVKYPFGSPQGSEVKFGKKIGVFSGECDIYQQARDACGVKIGKRYFLVYLMELADDLCYCLSDIADSL